jgi:hypothetical protein
VLEGRLTGLLKLDSRNRSLGFVVITGSSHPDPGSCPYDSNDAETGDEILRPVLHRKPPRLMTMMPLPG